jgi:hypothetical protein
MSRSRARSDSIFLPSVADYEAYAKRSVKKWSARMALKAVG